MTVDNFMSRILYYIFMRVSSIYYSECVVPITGYNVPARVLRVATVRNIAKVELSAIYYIPTYIKYIYTLIVGTVAGRPPEIGPVFVLPTHYIFFFFFFLLFYFSFQTKRKMFSAIRIHLYTRGWTYNFVYVVRKMVKKVKKKPKRLVHMESIHGV